MQSVVFEKLKTTATGGSCHTFCNPFSHQQSADPAWNSFHILFNIWTSYQDSSLPGLRYQHSADRFFSHRTLWSDAVSIALFKGFCPCSQSPGAKERVYSLWNSTLLSAMEWEKVASWHHSFCIFWSWGEGKADKTMRALETIFKEVEQGKKIYIRSQHLQAIFNHHWRLPLNPRHALLTFALGLVPVWK